MLTLWKSKVLICISNYCTRLFWLLQLQSHSNSLDYKILILFAHPPTYSKTKSSNSPIFLFEVSCLTTGNCYTFDSLFCLHWCVDIAFRCARNLDLFAAEMSRRNGHFHGGLSWIMERCFEEVIWMTWLVVLDWLFEFFGLEILLKFYNCRWMYLFKV